MQIKSQPANLIEWPATQSLEPAAAVARGNSRRLPFCGLLALGRPEITALWNE
jgi:hypothetical protein